MGNVIEMGNNFEVFGHKSWYFGSRKVLLFRPEENKQESISQLFIGTTRFSVTFNLIDLKVAPRNLH